MNTAFPVRRASARPRTFIQQLSGLKPALLLLSALAGTVSVSSADEAPAALSNTIDLPTALKLAGAQNLEIRIARERLAEAQAAYTSSKWQFFPWISPGIAWRRHDNLIQDVAGNIINVHKESWQYGPSFSADLAIGDALYKKLAARQLVRAAEAGVEAQRQDSVLAAAQSYFELVRAQAAVQAAEEAVSIADNYARQVGEAVQIGTAFRGDALRADVQAARNRQTLRQAHEAREVAAARLIQTLHLEPGTALTPRDAQLAPVDLVARNDTRSALLSRALANREELQQGKYQLEAARHNRDAAKYGPLIPNLGAQVFLGGFGGGRSGISDHYGKAEDYQVTLGWRIGPGGLFDKGRVESAEARWRAADLARERVATEIARQVAEAHARTQSLAEQMGIAANVLKSAEEELRLTRERKSFAVGAVLEDIQAQEDFTRARLDYLNAVAEYDKAQYALVHAVGGLAPEGK